MFLAIPPTNPSTNEPKSPLDLAFQSVATGSLHYGFLRFAAYLGKVFEHPLNISSYILLHTIKNVFEESVNRVCRLGCAWAGTREESANFTLKKYLWKVVGVLEAVQKKIDQVYTSFFRLIRMPIRSAEETATLSNRELLVPEVIRKVFLENVKDQVMFISSWEIGIRGAQMLLKTKIATLIPSTVPYYVGQFFVRLYVRVQGVINANLQEQKEEMKEAQFKDRVQEFRELYKHVKHQRKAENSATAESTEETSPESTEEAPVSSIEETFGDNEQKLTILHEFYTDDYEGTELNLDQKVAVLSKVFSDIKAEITPFKERWQNYLTDDISDLEYFAERYTLKLDRLAIDPRLLEVWERLQNIA